MGDVSQVQGKPEDLIQMFEFDRLLNQDQGGRRIVLLGRISNKSALITAERTAFPTFPPDLLSTFTQSPTSLTHLKNLGANDIYFWYLASTTPSPDHPDVKLNLIYPCTAQHIKKYSGQGLRVVTETKEVYETWVRPYMEKKRGQGRLDWVFNILEGRTEVEDVIFREHGEEGFLLLPDLNWDRKTLTSLHLLGLVERRDIWSVRDLRKSHITWLQHMREKFLDATVRVYPTLEKDQLKLYVHYQPTYYHFHVHIVHVALEAGATQAVGKAFGLQNIIGQLETLEGGPENGMTDVNLTYFIGEASELWTEVLLPLKEAKKL